MADAFNHGSTLTPPQGQVVQSTVSIQSVLTQVTNKGLQVMNSWIRDFPELMYVGLYLPNYYKDGGKLKRGGLTYQDQKTLNFKSIGALESDMTIGRNEVVWYEARAFSEKALITAAVTADNDVPVDPENIGYFAVDDVVIIRPGAGSTTTAHQQTRVTAVNTTTNVVTLEDNITCLQNDYLMFAYNLIEHGVEINRGVGDEKVSPMRVYFQKFGGSVEFDSQEINQSRLFNDAQEYVKSKFAIVINRSNNNFARAFYLGRNIAGAKSETQGLDTLVREKEAREGVGSAIYDATGIATPKEKAAWLVDRINTLCTAPVYTGSEVPTFYCNYQFITSLSEIMFGMSNFYTLQEKEIDFGLTEYSSPYFKNVKFIVSHVLNNVFPTQSKAYAFPRHLVTFRAPEYQSVSEAGALVKTTNMGYTVLKMPQVSPDIVKYTAQMNIANIFAGQSYSNTYARIDNF